MEAMPGTTDPLTETTFIKGHQIRRDESPESSSIMDWDAGVLTFLDHPAKRYVQLSVEEMAELAEEAAEALEGTASELTGAAVEGSREAAQEAEAAHAAEGGEQATLDVRVSSDRTGQRRDFAGYAAEQVLITLEIMGEHTPGEYEADAQSGGLAVVTELWLSQDFPEHGMMQEMRKKVGNHMAEEDTGEGILGSMEALLTYDPRIKFAFEKNQETIDAMDGIALRTTMHVVTLPEWIPLDRDKVLADQDRSLTDDAMDAAKSGARDAARSAVRNVTGRLFGRKKEPEPPPEPEVPEQSILFRVISEISSVEALSLDPTLFQPPADYTLQEEATPVSG